MKRDIFIYFDFSSDPYDFMISYTFRTSATRSVSHHEFLVYLFFYVLVSYIYPITINLSSKEPYDRFSIPIGAFIYGYKMNDGISVGGYIDEGSIP